MTDAYKVWLFRILGAITGVGLTAVAGVVADTGHWGVWFPIVATIQAFALAGLGKLVKKWSA